VLEYVNSLDYVVSEVDLRFSFFTPLLLLLVLRRLIFCDANLVRLLASDW